MKYFRKQSGFTLIELIVVIAIIGVLAGILVANFGIVRSKTRDGVRKKDLEQMRLALETYRIDTGGYPVNIVGLYGVTISAPCDPNHAFVSTGTNPITYMEKVPCDPKNKNKKYYYDPYPAGSTGKVLRYDLYACAENGNDQSADDPPATFAASHCNGIWSGSTGKVFKVTNP